MTRFDRKIIDSRWFWIMQQSGSLAVTYISLFVGRGINDSFACSFAAVVMKETPAAGFPTWWNSLRVSLCGPRRTAAFDLRIGAFSVPVVVSKSESGLAVHRRKKYEPTATVVCFYFFPHKWKLLDSERTSTVQLFISFSLFSHVRLQNNLQVEMGTVLKSSFNLTLASYIIIMVCNQLQVWFQNSILQPRIERNAIQVPEAFMTTVITSLRIHRLVSNLKFV